MVGEIQGTMLSGKELAKAFRQRKLVTEKPSWKEFEDRVWRLLYNFGFSDLNDLGKFFVDVGTGLEPDRVEIDVLGRADENVFVIECKTAEETSPKDMRNVITRLTHYRTRIVAAIRKYYAGKEIKVSFVIATRNIDWKDNDIAEARTSNIFIWTEKQIDFLEDLADLRKLIGDAARYQLYSIMFPNQEIKSLEVQEPALRGKIGKKQYFSFLSTPENLLRIGYVHHRQGFDPDVLKALPQTYQRMLKASKLKQINQFISDGHYFPNSIIVSFAKQPRFDLASSGGLETQYGTLYLPNRYRSAWIIDGQHRLYGYAKNERRKTARIPVVAFVGLKPSEQAQLFVEINENQTAVEKNLLWDLASDIYQESDDPKQILDLHIANVTKLLDVYDVSPLKDHVYIPSYGKKSAERNVTMTTLCGGIKRTKLLSANMLGKYGFERAGFEKFAAERVATFFKVIANNLYDDWEKGDKGYIRSNNGIAALLTVLQHVLKYYNNADNEQAYMKGGLAELEKNFADLLQPLVKELKDQGFRKKLKEQLGAAGQTESANLMCLSIRLEVEGFPLPHPNTPVLPKEVSKVKENVVEPEIKQIELYLRDFVAEKLKEKYGAEWYEKGIPGDARDPRSVRGAFEELFREELSKRPYRKEEYTHDPKKMLEWSQVGQLQQIIMARENWDLFESTFSRRPNVEKHFGDFIELRNVVQAHFRSLDEVVWLNGRAAICWIHKCLKSWIDDRST